MYSLVFRDPILLRFLELLLYTEPFFPELMLPRFQLPEQEKQAHGPATSCETTLSTSTSSPLCCEHRTGKQRSQLLWLSVSFRDPGPPCPVTRKSLHSLPRSCCCKLSDLQWECGLLRLWI